MLAVQAGFAAAPEGEAAEHDTFRLPDIVIFGAARDERALLDTPNAASVVGEEAIRRRRPSTYAEMPGDAPGLSIEGGPRHARGRRMRNRNSRPSWPSRGDQVRIPGSSPRPRGRSAPPR